LESLGEQEGEEEEEEEEEEGGGVSQYSLMRPGEDISIQGNTITTTTIPPPPLPPSFSAASPRLLETARRPCTL